MGSAQMVRSRLTVRQRQAGDEAGLSLLLVLVLTPRGFPLCTAAFPSSQDPTFPNSNSILRLF